MVRSSVFQVLRIILLFRVTERNYLFGYFISEIYFDCIGGSPIAT